MSTKKEILFDGHFYDVTDFIEKHPGGSVILYYTEKGEDSTEAIQQFHFRSIKKVKLMMSALKKRPASDSEIGLDSAVLKKNRSLTEDFAKLHLEFENNGYFKPSYMQAFVRLMEVFVFTGFGISLFCSQNFGLQVLGVLSITAARIRAGFLMHEMGHYSYSGNPKFDRVSQSLIEGIFGGLSATRWRRQHNRHHAMTQRLKHDVDLETMPIFAYNSKVVRNPEAGKGFIIQYQAYLFAVNCLVVCLVWQFYLEPKFIFKRKILIEMLPFAGYVAVCYYLGFWCWLFSNWFGTVYMLFTFSLNHTFMPVTSEPAHWVEYSLNHTADVEHAPWCDWMTGYLNYQIEHHLFPAMPNFRLPFIKDKVRALAEKHNIKYHVHSYPEAVRKMFRNLSEVSKEVANI